MEVSVVVLCRDNPAELAETLASIPPAAGPVDLEVLVVDGSSTDGCRRQLEAVRWSTPGPTLRWTPMEPRGIYHAMNQSLELVRGEWMAFMNAGDVYESAGLLRLLAHARGLVRERGADRAVAVFAQAWVDPPPGSTSPWLTPDPATQRLDRWLRHMVPCHQAFLFAVPFARLHPYDERGTPIADRAVMRCAIARSGTACYLRFPVCRFRLGGLSSRAGAKAWFAPWPRLLPRLMRYRARWMGRFC